MKVQSDLDALHPFVKEQALKVLAECKAQGLNVGVFEALRTLERQKYLVSIGNSKTLNSYHRLGLAIDFVFKTSGGNWTWERSKEDWDKLADIVESCGFSSGWRWKSFKDGPHAQMDFVGVKATTLYAKLDSLDNDLAKFYKHVDEMIKADPKLSKLQKITKPKVEDKPLNLAPKQEFPGTEPLIPVSNEVKVDKAPQESPSIILLLIKFILALFGVKK
jgi:hypothetical protein